MQLPEWLREAMEYMGFDWPATDESVLSSWADQFRTLSSQAATAGADLAGAADHLRSCNEGAALNTVLTEIAGPDSNIDAINNFQQACDVAATGCDVCAGIVLALKGVVVFQLALIAPALAAGPVGFIVKRGVDWAIGMALDYAVTQLMTGGD